MQSTVELQERAESDALKRDKKARALAAMGNVGRLDDGFEVTTAGRKRATYKVWRDIDNRVKCACPDFRDAEDARFRCEHILAVKYYLEPPSEEVSPDGVAAAEGAQHVDSEQELPSATVNAVYTAPGEFDEVVSRASRFENILLEFKRPLPEALIKQRVGWRDRSGREHEVDYIEWHVVADILDRVAPNWGHHVRDLTQVGGLVAVTAAITIDGVTREGIGTGEAIDERGIKKAEHDALKRAAVKFGIARELYRRDPSSDDGDYDASSRVDDPVARTLSDLITPKQLVAIRAIANAGGIDSDQRALELFGCRPEELTKKAASQLITDLKGQSSTLENERRAS